MRASAIRRRVGQGQGWDAARRRLAPDALMPVPAGAANLGFIYP